MARLKNKVAIVTGASKGIGAGIAKAYANAGASVVVNYASDAAGAARVVNEINAEGGTAIAIQADVSLPGEVKRLFAESKETFGNVNVLVNNAGVFRFDSLEAVTEEEFHRQFNINVLGTILASQQAVDQFGTDGGSIINISSVISESPLPHSVVYAATKGAVDTIAGTLSQELGSRKIRVNTIAPGGVETEGSRTLGMIGSEMETQIVAQTPLGRIGQPGDIAKVAVFLASDDAGWINGERIVVSGGMN